MPLRYDIRPKTRIGEQVQELAERLPYKEWYLPDPYDPASYLMPISGMTRQALLASLPKRGFREVSKRELAELKKITEILPKKAVEYLKEINLPTAITTTRGYGGTYEPMARKITAYTSGRGPGYRPPYVYAHEFGHLINDVLKFTPERQTREAIAEYLAKHLHERARLPFTPQIEREALPIYKELSQMVSKNPYMNVYRYLQKILGK